MKTYFSIFLITFCYRKLHQTKIKISSGINQTEAIPKPGIELSSPKKLSITILMTGTTKTISQTVVACPKSTHQTVIEPRRSSLSLEFLLVSLHLFSQGPSSSQIHRSKVISSYFSWPRQLPQFGVRHSN